MNLPSLALVRILVKRSYGVEVFFFGILEAVHHDGTEGLVINRLGFLFGVSVEQVSEFLLVFSAEDLREEDTASASELLGLDDLHSVFF